SKESKVASTEEDAVDLSSLTGAQIFQQLECATCHAVEPDVSTSTGPSLYDLYGSEVTLEGGKKVKADETYIRESILKANAKIVEGYMPVMPSYESQLKDKTLGRLVTYIKSLTE